MRGLIPLALLLFASVSHAIGVVGTAAQAYNAGGSGALTVAHNSGATGSRRMLVCGLYVYDATQDVTGFTYNGVALTQAGSFGTSISTTGFTRLYYLANPATGSNTVSVTRGSAQDELMYVCQTFNDVNQTTPMSGAQTVNSNSNTATIPTITLPGGSDWSVGMYAGFDAAGFTITESDTLIAETHGTMSASGYALQRGDANLSWTLTNTPDNYAIGMALIHDGGAGASTLLIKRRRH